MAIEVGTILEGVVTGITRFGAFVDLPGKVTGLVHISEIADTYVQDVKDYLKEGDRVRVKVINVDGSGKIGLSIKQASPDYDPHARHRRHRPVPANFEDKLARFMKESEERMQDLRRKEAKRGGRGAGRPW